MSDMSTLQSVKNIAPGAALAFPTLVLGLLAVGAGYLGLTVLILMAVL